MKNLTPSELRYIQNLRHWEKWQKRSEILLYNLLLLVGGILIIVGLYTALKDMSNRLILIYMLPYVLSGILFVWLYCSGRRRIRERTEIGRIFHKLLADQSAVDLEE